MLSRIYQHRVERYSPVVPYNLDGGTEILGKRWRAAWIFPYLLVMYRVSAKICDDIFRIEFVKSKVGWFMRICINFPPPLCGWRISFFYYGFVPRAVFFYIFYKWKRLSSRIQGKMNSIDWDCFRINLLIVRNGNVVKDRFKNSDQKL